MKWIVALACIFAPIMQSYGCTIFVVARNGMVLAGANEDMINSAPYAKHWVRYAPKVKGEKYGIVSFGYKIFAGYDQAAMNDAGLFLDYNALPEKVDGPQGLPKASMKDIRQMLGTCKTVEEALAFLKKYDFADLIRAQMVIGDSTGASAIVERSAVARRGDLDYQIGTNFRTSITRKDQITCSRFKACEELLSKGTRLSQEVVRSLLEKTSANSANGITWYSMVCDLKQRSILLFRKANFGKVVTLEIRKELAKGNRTIDMDELFAAQSVAAKS